jgi:AAA+ superfamily predicted ATPase
MADRDAFVRELRAAAQGGVPIVCVVTHEERRALALVGEALRGARVLVWRSTDGWTDGPDALDPLEAVRRALRPEHGVARVLLDLHPWLGEPRVVRALRDVAASRRDVPLVLVMPSAALPPELDRDARVLPLPLPDARAIGEAFDAERLDGAWPRDAFVRAALGLTLDEASRAFRIAAALADPGEALRHVVGEKRGALRRSACLELVDGDVSLDDVGGLEVLKSWLRARVLAFDPGAREFGLAEPRGMLVCGVQGCGKSLVSKATARVLGLPLVRLDFAELFAAASPEHAVHEATRAVEAVAPVVLWVDEIEKGLGAGTAADARHGRVFGAFLTWLQERRAPVFVAATANEVEHLPPELARRGRFDEVFFVDLPSPSERAEILAVHLRRCGRRDTAYDVAELARDLEHWSGAEIEQMVSSALFRAYADRAELTDEHLRAAARELVPLATLYEEKVQALRQWGQARARRASADRRTLDLFTD